MKKTFTLLFALLFSTTLLAQHPGQHGRGGKDHPKPMNIEAMVSDLSAIQKKKLETITSESKKRVEGIQAELNTLRQQIRSLMMQDGDNSAKLFPLLDREGVLQAELTKEMYTTRIQVDAVLTPEQLKEFRARMEADRKKHHGKPEGKPKDKGPAPRPRR